MSPLWDSSDTEPFSLSLSEPGAGPRPQVSPGGPPGGVNLGGGMWQEGPVRTPWDQVTCLPGTCLTQDLGADRPVSTPGPVPPAAVELQGASKLLVDGVSPVTAGSDPRQRRRRQGSRHLGRLTLLAAPPVSPARPVCPCPPTFRWSLGFL